MSALLTEMWAWYAVTWFVVLARMISRRMLYGSIKGMLVDDYLMLCAMLTYTALLIVVKILTYTPTNLIDPADGDVVLTDDNIKTRQYGSKLVVITEQTQILTLWAIKACLLVMYSRLTSSLRQNWLVKIVSGYVALSFVLMEILFFGAWCRPFSNYWKVPAPSMNCSAETNHMITNAVFNISSDIMIILIPMPVFLQSQLALKRKIILCGVFALGAFSILAAVLSKYYSLGDPYGTEWIYWYIREVSTAIITANLPLTWTLLQRVFRLGSFAAKYGKSSGHRTGDAATTATTGGRLRSAYGNLTSRNRDDEDRRRRGAAGPAHELDISPSSSQEQINGQQTPFDIPLKIYQRNEVRITTEEVVVKDGGRTSPQGKASTRLNGITTFSVNDSPPGSINGDGKSANEAELGVVTKVYRGV